MQGAQILNNAECPLFLYFSSSSAAIEKLLPNSHHGQGILPTVLKKVPSNPFFLIGWSVRGDHAQILHAGLTSFLNGKVFVGH
jgi:hypothetical protein